MLTQKRHQYVPNDEIVSVSFPSQKSKIELEIAMKTWGILKASYLIALLHISINEKQLICLK